MSRGLELRRLDHERLNPPYEVKAARAGYREQWTWRAFIRGYRKLPW